ncbi:MAG: hypothetical protein A2287_10060 [Candidatus Melainabacteria bacterium RIFOXYA12_FULL_32_12]|nr:MAG: hypothetical protein A2255_01550 [Candidatus Melainabacteria bacterium RIFOXYA2_FULL_32_9]OGI27958.1 MAG: hypothetical protein A2287_10060 [Candidatus Melainabacteria bacterium RIFOXYA12_FULL_32_12]
MRNSTLQLVKTSFQESLGIISGKSRKENAVAAALTFAPNIPAYLMPSYFQASKAGNAENIEKSEGLRGIITGGLDGAVIGALTARKKALTPKRISIFIGIGALLDYISSRILPPLGEKLGKKVYQLGQDKNKTAEVKPAQGNSQKTFLGQHRFSKLA